jgi:hypothetical protein
MMVSACGSTGAASLPLETKAMTQTTAAIDFNIHLSFSGPPQSITGPLLTMRATPRFPTAHIIYAGSAPTAPESGKLLPGHVASVFR